MKKCFLLIALLAVYVNMQAQTRVWLSGYHSNASIRYLYDGSYSRIDAVWEGGTPVNNTNVVVYGQFKKDQSGRAYFAIEKSEKTVTLFSGNYKKASHNCPVTGDEGQMSTTNGKKITYSSFVPLDTEGYMQVTEAEWGIRVCKGAVLSVYYIRSIAGNIGQREVQQEVIDPTGVPPASGVKRITGKVVSLKKAAQLVVKNYAEIVEDDGSTTEISSTRLMKVGERVTLEGSFKTVYWDGVMKTSEIFFVSKIIPSASGNSGGMPAASLTAQETELYQLIMEYRRQLNLPAIPLSKSLCYVAQTHARDLQENYVFNHTCNPHSWSDKGNWTPFCYTSDHKQAALMWAKPKELTSYKGDGYEIAYWNGGAATAKAALKSWKGSPGHNNVIVNQNNWKNLSWKAIGIGISQQYAIVWFGEEVDG